MISAIIPCSRMTRFLPGAICRQAIAVDEILIIAWIPLPSRR
jgi:hypothetical protein